jgi:hypothetical protein
MLENIRKDRQDAWDKLKAANEERHQGWERLKSLTDTKVALSEKGKAMIATAVVAPAVFEGAIHLPGNMGLGLSGAAILLSVLQGDKAFSVGRWLKEKLVADSGLSLDNEASLLKDSDENATGGSASDDYPEGYAPLGNSRGEMTQQERQRPASRTEQNDNLPAGTILIGTDVRGKNVYRTWKELKSILILGLAEGGKSVTASWLTAQCIRDGASIAIIDRHGRSDESLTARLSPFESFFACQPARTPEDAFKNVVFMKNELDSRIEGDSPCDTPLVLVIDEFSEIMKQVALNRGDWLNVGMELASLIEEINTQGRKYKVYVVAIGQIANASRSGGTEIRDLFHTRMLHGMRDSQAAMLLPKEYRQQAARLEKGQIILDMEGKAEPFVVQIPFLSQKEMQSLASQCQTRAPARPSFDKNDVKTMLLPETMEDLPLGQDNGRVVQYSSVKTSTVATPERYRQPLEAYKAGNTSARTLGQALGINKDKAAGLIQQMKAARLINV